MTSVPESGPGSPGPLIDHKTLAEHYQKLADRHAKMQFEQERSKLNEKDR